MSNGSTDRQVDGLHLIKLTKADMNIHAFRPFSSALDHNPPIPLRHTPCPVKHHKLLAYGPTIRLRLECTRRDNIKGSSPSGCLSRGIAGHPSCLVVRDRLRAGQRRRRANRESYKGVMMMLGTISVVG